ncbi:MAG: alpha-1,2-fucosyltransferase [Paludibacter sp.]|nr:alpha-1,2-fucosyltransferase [Paludibacter sp.]
MVIVNVKNGLGNQMFQYAFSKVLEWKYQIPVMLDLMRDENDDTPLVNDLDVFEIERIQEVNQQLTKPFKPFSVAYYRNNKKYIQYVYYKLRRLLQPNRLITERYPSQPTKYFDKLKPNKKYYFLGFWQNASYYLGYEEKIKLLFQPKDATVLQSDIAIEISLSTYDTVSLHIRRGDYQTSGFIEPASATYIYAAIDLMKSKLRNPFFFIFTDDPQWVKSELKLQMPHKLVEGNENEKSYIDILLMSHCKHNIIANSSFSWWGAWLNNNPTKIVIAPKKWYASVERDKYSACITPNEWIRL